MAISIDQMFREFKLCYSEPTKWNERLEAKFNGVYVVSLTNDPHKTTSNNIEYNICLNAFKEWTNEATNLEIDSIKVDKIDQLKDHLNKFWKPDQNILYNGHHRLNQTLLIKELDNSIHINLDRRYLIQGGYWLKL